MCDELRSICFVAIKVLRQALSALGMRLESIKCENKDTAETLFSCVTLILPVAQRVGCEEELLGNISWISCSREINALPSC